VAHSGVPSTRTWLRSPRFDAWLQLGALAGVAPALVLYAAWGARASSLVPLASLIAIPFLHVFGSFFFAFSTERNASASTPRALAMTWALWGAAVLALSAWAPRALATFALVYGGWHIARQNFGFLRELAQRDGLAGDRVLRRLDLAVCLQPAIALWLLIAWRGPWRFWTADVYHPSVPAWLVALAFAAVPATVIARERRLGARRGSSAAGLLLVAGNFAALLGPALVLDELTIIYTLSASFHGVQYLAYLAERERERRPFEQPTAVLVPLASAIALSMAAWATALALAGWLFSPARAGQLLLAAWYAIVPFHYFVDGRIWRARRR